VSSEKEKGQDSFSLDFLEASYIMIILLWILVTTSRSEPWEEAAFRKWHREICPG